MFGDSAEKILMRAKVRNSATGFRETMCAISTCTGYGSLGLDETPTLPLHNAAFRRCHSSVAAAAITCLPSCSPVFQSTSLQEGISSSLHHRFCPSCSASRHDQHLKSSCSRFGCSRAASAYLDRLSKSRPLLQYACAAGRKTRSALDWSAGEVFVKAAMPAVWWRSGV